MLPYCLKCRKNTENKNQKFVKTKNRWIMLLSNSAVCDSKKSKFFKEQETSGIQGSLTTSISKISFVGPILKVLNFVIFMIFEKFHEIMYP